MSKYGNLTGTKLEGFPDEVIDKMLERQVEQGNPRDIEVFKKYNAANREEGGFDWSKTEEWRHDRLIWNYTINCKYFVPFFELYPKKSLDNTVIEVLTEEHGKKVIEWWRKQGIYTNVYVGSCCKKNISTDRYYGVINGHFGNYFLSDVKANNAKIITLPEEKALPRYMMCWDTDELEAEKRLVIYYNKQLVYPFITLCETSVERYLKGGTNCFFKVFKHAKEIEEPENKMDAAITEICKELDNVVNQLKSLNK